MITEVRAGRTVLGGGRVDPVCLALGLERVTAWAAERSSRSVCFCNVHSLMTTRQDDGFRAVIDAADLNLPDGAPVAWMLRRMGYGGQRRISGPDFMWAYLGQAEVRRERIFLYGATPVTLDRLQARIRSAFPGLIIAGAWSPPFRPLTREEDEQVTQRINDSGAQTVWVGLGCPAQERWLHAHRGRVQAVMLGVGAAFDFHAGSLGRAPVWMRRLGLEWLHRLWQEPRRLWRRYLVTNSAFVGAVVRQVLRGGRL